MRAIEKIKQNNFFKGTLLTKTHLVPKNHPFLQHISWSPNSSPLS